MILTHESGSQEDQFAQKKWRQKISWDYPFKNFKIFPVATIRDKERLAAPVAGCLGWLGRNLNLKGLSSEI